MRINHNIPALNAHRMLNRNANTSASVLERLSSGRKINRAADDAAGMAISEKMKAQVRGLAKSAQNTLDGISLIQTAEGAMNEVHSMLQRMRELAVQSANGTTTDDDRIAIQAEINQLTSEVNRIANGTEFNTRNVLRGNEKPNSNTTVHRISTGTPAQFVSSGTFSIDDVISGNLTSSQLFIEIDGKKRKVNLDKLDGTSGATKDALLGALNDAMDELGQAIFNNDNKIEIRTASIGGNSEIKITGDAAKVIFKNENSGAFNVRGEAEKDTGVAKGSFYFDTLPEPGSTITIGDEKIEFYDSSVAPYTGSNRAIDIETYKSGNSISGLIKRLSDLEFDGVTLGIDSNGDSPSDKRLIVEADEKGFKGQSIFIEGTPKEFVTNLQVGPNEGQGFRLSVGDIRAFKLKISSENPKGNTGVIDAAFNEDKSVTDGLSSQTIEHAVDVSTEERATAAITVYNNAIVGVAQMRGALGAIQNRLEYTAANLENTQENLTAALSRIEDTDMALEMSEFTKYNILIQAGTAMLAQANQRPQTVLQLLGG